VHEAAPELRPVGFFFPLVTIGYKQDTKDPNAGISAHFTIFFAGSEKCRVIRRACELSAA
jgi:hypothetical protein